jgi:hypothetical protein
MEHSLLKALVASQIKLRGKCVRVYVMKEGTGKGEL